MRGIILAVVTAAGIGLVGTAGVSAAPVSGAAIGNAANETSTVEHVQHWRWGSGGHYRYGSRRAWRWCHGPYTSRRWRC